MHIGGGLVDGHWPGLSAERKVKDYRKDNCIRHFVKFGWPSGSKQAKQNKALKRWESQNAQYLWENSGWFNCGIMVRDLRIRSANRMRLLVIFPDDTNRAEMSWRRRIHSNGNGCPPLHSEWKKRSTSISVGTALFLRGIFGKFPYHMNSCRNFRILFDLMGKQPQFWIWLIE